MRTRMPVLRRRSGGCRGTIVAAARALNAAGRARRSDLGRRGVGGRANSGTGAAAGQLTVLGVREACGLGEGIIAVGDAQRVGGGRGVVRDGRGAISREFQQVSAEGVEPVMTSEARV